MESTTENSRTKKTAKRILQRLLRRQEERSRIHAQTLHEHKEVETEPTEVVRSDFSSVDDYFDAIEALQILNEMRRAG